MSFLNEVHGGAIQPKLEVGAPNDKFEVEADQMADKVMRMPAPEAKLQRTVSNLDLSVESAKGIPSINKKVSSTGAIQKKCSDCETEEKNEEQQIIQKKDSGLTPAGDLPIQPKVISKDDTSTNLRRHINSDYGIGIQRKGDGNVKPLSQKITRLSGGDNIRRKEDEFLQKKGNENLGRGPPMGDFSSNLQQSKQGGASMDNGTQSFMNSRFGADFSGVKIHTGGQATEMSNSINAKAFTHQNHVYFNKGQYQPDTHAGKTLLAHELTHTIQQGSVSTGVQTKLEVGASNDIYEKEADQMADSVMRMPLNIASNTFDMQRKCAGCEHDFVQRKTWDKEEQYNPYSTKTTDVQRKVLTLFSGNLQLQTIQSKHSRGPPSEVLQRQSSTIQRSFWDDPLGSIGNAVSGAVDLVGGSIDAGVDWLKEQLSEMASAMPGFSLFSVVIGQDPITGRSVERNGYNFINAGLDLIPNGAEYKRKLEDDGGMDQAAAWLDEQIDLLDINVVDVQSDFSSFISSLSLADVASPSAALSRGINTFRPYIERLVRFATTVAIKLLEIVKEIAINALLEFVRDQTPWYPLITVVLGEDPITGDEVERNGMNILSGFILLHPEGEAQLAQMEESGALQRAADWVDESIVRVAQIINGIKNGFAVMWESFSIATLLDPIGAFTQIYSLFSSPVSELIAFAIEVALIILHFIKEALISRLIVYAQTIPGYHLVTVIMGKDVFSEEPIERSAINIIRGFMSLVPGGEEKFQEMQQTGAIEEALAWIEGAVTELDLTWEMVRGLFTTAWSEFSLADLATPIETFMRVLDLFGAPLLRLIRFVGRVVIKLVEIALRIMGFPFELIGSIISRAQAAYELIKNDPIGFLKNILKAVKQAFVQFFGNILTHLMTGVGGWLFGQLGDAGITIPPDFSFQSILGLVFEILGITRESIFEKLREKVGPERWAQIEGSIETMTGIWSFISDVFTRGPIAIWEKVQEQLSNLWETVLSAAQNWIMTRIITQVTVRLLSMLDPTGIMAVVNSFMVFFSAVQSAIEYMIPMLEMLNSFLGGVVQIAEGNIQPAADFLEQTMARGMPILIGFMANQVGLGGIGARIREVIESIQVRVDAGIQWAIDQAWEIGSGLLEMGRNAVGAVRDAIRGWWGSRTTFTSRTNQEHELYFNGEGSRAVLIMASNNPDGLEDKIRERKEGANMTPAKTVALNQALSIKGEMDAAIRTHTAAQDSDSQETDSMRPIIDGFLDRIKIKLIHGDIDGTLNISPSNITYQMQGSKAKKVTADPLTSMPGNTRGTPAASSSARPEGWDLSQRVNSGSYIRDEHGVDLRTSTGQLRLSKPWKRVHLLNHLVHGPAVNWNLVPATQSVNSALSSAHENDQKTRANNGEIQKYEITVNYYLDDEPLEVRNEAQVIIGTGKKSDYPESFTVKRWVQNDNGEMSGGSPVRIEGTELPQSDGTNFAHLITHYEGVIDRYFTGVDSEVAQTITFSSWYNSAINSSIRTRIAENNPADWAALREYFYTKRTARQNVIPPNVSPKLKIGSPNDPLELEADQMADKVMRMPKSNVQVSGSGLDIQRKCSGCEDEALQRKPIASFIQRVSSVAIGETASNSFSSNLNANKSSGRPMDSSTQGFMSERFGADFSSVKIHTGSKANELSDQIQAKAFTTGNNIYFNQGEYSPETTNGKHLLAHELTHTIQQGGTKTESIQRKNFFAHYREDLAKGFGGEMEIDMTEQKGSAKGYWKAGMSGWINFKPSKEIHKSAPDSSKIGLVQIVKVTNLEAGAVSPIGAKHPTVSSDVETKESGTGASKIEEGYFVDKNFTDILSGKEPHSKYYNDQGKAGMTAGSVSRDSQRTNNRVTYSEKHGMKKGELVDNAVLTDGPEWSKSSKFEFETYAQSDTHNYGGIKWGFEIGTNLPFAHQGLSELSILPGMENYVKVEPLDREQLFTETPTAKDAANRFEKHGKTPKSAAPVAPAIPAPVKVPTATPVKKTVQPKLASKIHKGTSDHQLIQRKVPWELVKSERELDPAKVPSTFNYELVNHRLIAHNPTASDLDQIVEVIDILNLYFKVAITKVKIKKILESKLIANKKGKVNIDITPFLPEPVKKYLENLEAWYAAWRVYIAEVGTFDEWFDEVQKIPNLSKRERAEKVAEYHKNSPKSTNEYTSVCHNFVMLLTGGDDGGVIPGSSGANYSQQITRDGQKITDFYQDSLEGKGAYKEVKQSEVQVGDIVVFKASAAAMRKDSGMPKTGIVHSAVVIRVAGKTIEVIEKENPRSPVSSRTVAQILHEYRKEGVTARFLSPGLAGMPKGDEVKTGLTTPSESYSVANGIAAEDTYVLFTVGVDYSRAHEDKKLMRLIAENQKESVEFEVHGYASIDGDEMQNMNLSGHRAIAVKKALLTHFPKGSNAKAFAHGETEHFGGLKENRRAGIKLIGGDIEAKSSTKLNDTKRYSLNLRLTSLAELMAMESPPPKELNILLEFPPEPNYGDLFVPFTDRLLLASGREAEQILENRQGAYDFFHKTLSLKPEYASYLADFSTSFAYDTQLSIEFPSQEEDFTNKGFIPSIDGTVSYDLLKLFRSSRKEPEFKFDEPTPVEIEEQEDLEPKNPTKSGDIQRKPINTFSKRTNSDATSGSSISSFGSGLIASKGNGHAMDTSTQSFMENGFGTDFSKVRIHTGNSASDLSDQIQAKAFTTGSDIYFNQGEYRPNTSSGKHLLAHELTHTIQQEASQPSIQRQGKPNSKGTKPISIPKTGYDKVHDRLLKDKKAGTILKPWNGKKTATLIQTEFMRKMSNLRPALLQGKGVTKKQLDAEITPLLLKIKKWFPMITKRTDPKTVLKNVKLMNRNKSKLDSDLTKRILTALLGLKTSLNHYAYVPTDKTFLKMLEDLLKNGKVKRIAENFAINQSGYHKAGARGKTNVIINKYVTNAGRPALLVHEFMHYFSHPAFDEWLLETNASPYYAEGFAEFVTRSFAKSEGISRSGYQTELKSVENDVAKFIPENDIFRAFFAGEVWRLEHRSKTSKKQFKKQVKLNADSSGKKEVQGSKGSKGINQRVGKNHYRFLNFEIHKSKMKKDHKSMLKRVLKDLKSTKKPFKVSFTGYANDFASKTKDLALSKTRAGKFNEFALSEGIKRGQITNLKSPHGKGNVNPIAGNKNALGRAFNRRVDLKIS